MHLKIGGNDFFTNLREARRVAARAATATVYEFSGNVRDGQIAFTGKQERPLYLVMRAGEGASESSLEIVQEAMAAATRTFEREDFKWQ